jgi:hypothetical protein
MTLWTTNQWTAAIALGASLAVSGCGYHTGGSKVELPQNIHTIAIPGFVSRSQTFRIEQLLTDAVVREFNSRTQYHVINERRRGCGLEGYRSIGFGYSARLRFPNWTRGQRPSHGEHPGDADRPSRQGAVRKSFLSFSRSVRALARPPQFLRRRFSGRRSPVARFRAHPGGEYPGGLLMLEEY